MARDAEHLRPGVVLAAEPGEPGRAPAKDGRNDRDGLDIVDRRRAAVEPGIGGERGLDPRHPLLALKAFQQPGLLAADIGAGAAMDDDVEIPPRSAGVGADQPGFARFLDRRFQPFRLAEEFAPDIDEGGMGSHGETGEQRTFNQFMRIVPYDIAILAGSGLALVRIDDQVGRPAVRFLRHERPFQPGREPGSAAAAQAGILDLLDQRIAAPREQLPGAVPVAAPSRSGEPPVVLPVEVGEDAVLIGESHQAPSPAPPGAANSASAVHSPTGSEPWRPICEPGSGRSPARNAFRIATVFSGSRSS